jgi:cytochrome oxidase assembly protein ShyY1
VAAALTHVIVVGGTTDSEKDRPKLNQPDAKKKKKVSFRLDIHHSSSSSGLSTSCSQTLSPVPTEVSEDSEKLHSDNEKLDDSFV